MTPAVKKPPPPKAWEKNGKHNPPERVTVGLQNKLVRENTAYSGPCLSQAAAGIRLPLSSCAVIATGSPMHVTGLLPGFAMRQCNQTDSQLRQGRCVGGCGQASLMPRIPQCPWCTSPQKEWHAATRPTALLPVLCVVSTLCRSVGNTETQTQEAKITLAGNRPQRCFDARSYTQS